MTDIPRLALSVRQPWAWAIIHGGKDIENRDWRRPNPGLSFRGEVAIHASQGMTRAEYEDARDFMARIGVECPWPAHLQRGGIVGVVRIVDMVKDHESPWFMGRIGLVLAGPRPVTFTPSSGALGFFEWKPASAPLVPEPARWMLRYGAQPAKADPEPVLF